MALSFSSPLINNPMLRGSLAAPKQRFGEFDRYAIAPIHTRFDTIEWLVWDADLIDEATGLAAIIRQALHWTMPLGALTNQSTRRV